MAHVSLHFKKEEQYLHLLLKAIAFYYKKRGNKEKGNISSFIKKQISMPLKREYQEIKKKSGVDVIKLYEEYEQKKQGLERNIKSKTRYPTGYDMIQSKLEEFDDE
ncbi:MAG: hypothetical protein K9K32_00200 [Halanaerobiales bacterium]|nr:hypothetical protein [Halanaerobiales bacterium]